MKITPGVRFLASAFAGLCVPPIFAIAGKRILEQRVIFLPTWTYAAFAVFGWPAFAAIRIILKEVKQRREAYAMGARLVPRVHGKLPGNLDVLRQMMVNWRKGDGLGEVIEEKGPIFNMHVLWDDMIVTIWPEHLHILLASDFPNYVKGERFQKGMSSMLGVGVFNADGEMWRFHRQLTRPFFTRDRISHFELFDRHTDIVTKLMKERLREGYAFDFQDLMARFTLDSAAEFLFGINVHSLSASLPYPPTVPHKIASGSETEITLKAQAFVKAFMEVQDVVSRRERMGYLWPLLEIFEDKTIAPMKVVNAFIEPIVAEAVAKKKAGRFVPKEKKDDIGEDETLLDHLVGLTEDPVVLKDETLNILLAGRDTTSATLTFTIYFLCIYPNVTARLREEILAKVGPNRRPTYDDVKDMKYLRAVINETLRLYPVVPFNVRESVKATVWPSPDPTQKPLYIPAGSKLPYSVFMMHRRKDLWGPDAEEFDPDRFLDARLKKYLSPRPFIFLPFNAGPRICLGQQFAYNEMSFMLIRLLQNFKSFSLEQSVVPPEFQPAPEWKNASGRKGIDKFFPKMALTMFSGGGLWIKAEEAEVIEA
ncbi:cytochrome p450 monooxygenase pc-3 [Moniliophthora roreri]|uniref:Putative cytochrome P450 monooxygenase pc-1 n=1 Tax=Moniliophthora roreri TaxID=221103 RepID=A0A0W0EXX3_MONRR|nr:cytochrome p450 monooxygenase pc-3 [Moniliophthora roreri]